MAAVTLDWCVDVWAHHDNIDPTGYIVTVLADPQKQPVGNLHYSGLNSGSHSSFSHRLWGKQ